jgi:AcrR family transcriptional regulator
VGSLRVVSALSRKGAAIAQEETGSVRAVDARREQLLELGAELFAARSYGEVPVDEIAERAGVSRGLLYHYFPSKRAFHLAVVDRALAEVRRLLTPDPELAPMAALEGSLTRFFGYIAERGPGVLSIAQGGGGPDPQLQARVEAFREGTVAQVLDGLGQLGLGQPPSAALLIGLRGWAGAVEGLAVGWLQHGQVGVTQVVALARRQLEACLAQVGIELPPS